MSTNELPLEKLVEAAMRNKKISARIHNIAYEEGDMSLENKTRIYEKIKGEMIGRRHVLR